MKITKCPMCGGALQATLTEYMTVPSIDLDSDGSVLDWAELEPCNAGADVSLYCENDHSAHDWAEYLRNKNGSTS